MPSEFGESGGHAFSRHPPPDFLLTLARNHGPRKQMAAPGIASLQPEANTEPHGKTRRQLWARRLLADTGTEQQEGAGTKKGMTTMGDVQRSHVRTDYVKAGGYGKESLHHHEAHDKVQFPQFPKTSQTSYLSGLPPYTML